MIDTAVILAVGETAHNSQLREQRPRAMLPALGKPMVVRVMDRLYRAGIRRFKLIVGINEGAVASYLNRQWMPDATIEFVLQSTETLGLLLARIARKVDRPFIIASYNSFTFERFMSSLIRQHDDKPDHLIISGARLSLSSQEHDNQFAIIDGQAISALVREKPEGDHLIITNHIICGHAFAERLKRLDDQKASTYGHTLFDIVTHYVSEPDSQASIAETSWILRVESDRDLLTLNKRLLDDSSDAHILSELPYTVKIIPPVRIDPQVSVGQGAIIGPHVYVERGASIGYGATVKEALLLERSDVPSNSSIENAIVSSTRVVQLS